MNADRRLTVILPVRGRVEFTRRWLAWARSASLPFPVVIADGSDAADSSAVAAEVAGGAADGRPWTHVARPPGHPRASVLARLADAAEAVRTPYAVLSANDDFSLAAGLAACADALDARSDAAACGGKAAAFVLPLDEPVWSSNARVRSPVSRPPIAGATALDRVEELMDAYDPLWYDVHRAEVMRAAFARVERAGLQDLNLMEILHAALVAAAGPVLRLPLPHLLRQADSAGSSSAEIAERGGLLSEMLSEGWGAQFDAFVAAAADAAGGTHIRPRMRAAYARYAHATFARTPGFGGRPPLRRRVADALKTALGARTVAALRSASAKGAPSTPARGESAAVLAFLSKGPQAR